MITPVLTAPDAAQAIVFYGRAFGADRIDRNIYPDGRIVANRGRVRTSQIGDDAPQLARRILSASYAAIKAHFVEAMGC